MRMKLQEIKIYNTNLNINYLNLLQNFSINNFLMNMKS